MKHNKLTKQAGLTLIEVTLVIAVLLGLISVLFIGVGAYKEGSDRAKCILNITNTQKAARSYQNMYEKDAGQILLLNELVGPNRMLENTPVCPAGGTYSYDDAVPQVGEAYLTCDYEAGTANAHAPKSTAGW